MTTILNNNSVLLFLISKFQQGVAICDIKSDIVLWNEEAEKIAGVKVKSADKSNWIYHHKFKNRDGHPLEESDRALYRALHEQKETKSETIYLSDTGKQVYIDARAYPLYNDENKLIGAVAFFQDVTNKVKMDNLLTEVENKLKEMQEYLQEYLNTLHV